MSTAVPPSPSMHRSGPGQPGGPRGRGPTAVSVGAASTIDPIRVLRRHLGWIIASILVGGMIGVGAYVLLGRYYSIYTAEVLFEIQPGLRESRELATDQLSDDLAFRLANTETVVLTSRQVLTTAMQHPEIRQTEWHRHFVTQDEVTGREIFDIESAVDDLEETLSASVLRGTNFFNLRWRASNPRDLPTVLNRIAAAYLDWRRELDHQVWNQNIDVFNDELRRTERELDDLDSEISSFIRQHGITSLDDPRYSQLSAEAGLLTEQIKELTAAESMSQTALFQTEGKLQGTVEPSAEDVREARQDSAVRMFDQSIAQFRTNLRQLEERLQPGHPEIERARRQLRAAEFEREEKLREVTRENLQARQRILLNDLDRFRTLLRQTQAEAEEVDGRLSDLAASHARYQAMEKRRERLEQDRQSDIETRKAIELLRTRSDAARVRKAQDALTPRERSFPRPAVVIPLATLIMLMLTVGVIFLRELTDQRIKSASDLAVLHAPGAPGGGGGRVLGVIPEMREDPTPAPRGARGAPGTGRRGERQPELVVKHHPHSVLAESYRQACALMMRAVERSGHQTILFVGGLPGAGTTTAVTNMASSLAAAGKKVLVIDANFRRPRLLAAMGMDDALNEKPGLGDLLVGAVGGVDEVIHREGAIGGTADGHVSTSDTDHLAPDTCRVDVIGPGTPANRVFERLHNGLFESVVAELRGRYDVILFDAPPAVVAGDAMILANRVDAAVLVVRANQEQRGLVARLLGQLADARCEHLGILLNRPRGTAGGYFKKNFETMARYSKA